LLEFADFVVAGSGEAAFDVAEKFGLDEFFGDSRAIYLNKRAFVAQAGGMEASARQVLCRCHFRRKLERDRWWGR